MKLLCHRSLPSPIPSPLISTPAPQYFVSQTPCTPFPAPCEQVSQFHLPSPVPIVALEVYTLHLAETRRTLTILLASLLTLIPELEHPNRHLLKTVNSESLRARQTMTRCDLEPSASTIDEDGVRRNTSVHVRGRQRCHDLCIADATDGNAGPLECYDYHALSEVLARDKAGSCQQ